MTDFIKPHLGIILTKNTVHTCYRGVDLNKRASVRSGMNDRSPS